MVVGSGTRDFMGSRTNLPPFEGCHPRFSCFWAFSSAKRDRAALDSASNSSGDRKVDFFDAFLDSLLLIFVVVVEAVSVGGDDVGAAWAEEEEEEVKSIDKATAPMIMDCDTHLFLLVSEEVLLLLLLLSLSFGAERAAATDTVPRWGKVDDVPRFLRGKRWVWGRGIGLLKKLEKECSLVNGVACGTKVPEIPMVLV